MARAPAKRDKFSDKQFGPIGRPTSYEPEFDELARKLHELGYTDEEVAKEFGISRQTLARWDAKFPLFRYTRLQGKTPADLDVHQAFRRRATGYEYKAEKLFLGPGGNVIRAETMIHVPPDPGAAALWLANRQRKRFSLKPENQAEGGSSVKIEGGLPSSVPAPPPEPDFSGVEGGSGDDVATDQDELA